MWYISIDLSLQTYAKVFFQISNFFRTLAEKRKIFKRIARLEYSSQCNVLYINGYVLTNSTNQWKAFLQILSILFRIIGRKPKKN